MATKAKSEEGAGVSIPYLGAYGNITKVLNKIQAASTPARFTQDFLATKLGLPGGSAKPLIPFLKRTGFLSTDGAPTDLYKEFRNDTLRPAAVAKAVKIGYAPLYEMSEYLHDLGDTELKGIVVQATGLEAGSSTVKGIIGSFKALKAFADFEAEGSDVEQDTEDGEEEEKSTPLPKNKKAQEVGIKLGYTINLNLPATSDVAVFNAIFKSLREHLID